MSSDDVTQQEHVAQSLANAGLQQRAADQGLLQSEALTKILLGLGTILNIPNPQGQKAIWLPKTQVTFLSLIVDAANQPFLLPQEKVQDFMQLATNIIDSPEVSDRWLAQMAGKMIAAAPAMQLSRLVPGALYKAKTMEIGWTQHTHHQKHGRQTWTASETQWLSPREARSGAAGSRGCIRICIRCLYTGWGV